MRKIQADNVAIVAAVSALAESGSTVGPPLPGLPSGGFQFLLMDTAGIIHRASERFVSKDEQSTMRAGFDGLSMDDAKNRPSARPTIYASVPTAIIAAQSLG